VIMCVESFKPYDLYRRIVIGGLIEGGSLMKNKKESSYKTRWGQLVAKTVY
jgi:hypothetical protein